MFLLTSHYLLIILKMIPLEIFQNLTGQICFVWLVGIYLHRVCTIEFGFLSLWSHESYWSWNVTWLKCNYDSFNKECFCVGKMDKNHDYCRVTFMINLVPKKLYCRLILNSLPSVNMFSMLSFAISHMILIKKQEILELFLMSFILVAVMFH